MASVGDLCTLSAVDDMVVTPLDILQPNGRSDEVRAENASSPDDGIEAGCKLRRKG